MGGVVVANVLIARFLFPAPGCQGIVDLESASRLADAALQYCSIFKLRELRIPVIVAFRRCKCKAEIAPSHRCASFAGYWEGLCLCLAGKCIPTHCAKCLRIAGARARL